MSASTAVGDALHARVDGPFDETVDRVQLEHELAGFESVATTRLDRLVAGALEEDVDRAALVVVCHAEVARDAVGIDPGLAALLPCTTAVYEVPGEELLHVRHVSVTKVARDIGAGPPGSEDALADLVELTGERMATVWDGIERFAVDG